MVSGLRAKLKNKYQTFNIPWKFQCHISGKTWKYMVSSPCQALKFYIIRRLFGQILIQVYTFIHE